MGINTSEIWEGDTLQDYDGFHGVFDRWKPRNRWEEARAILKDGGEMYISDDTELVKLGDEHARYLMDEICSTGETTDVRLLANQVRYLTLIVRSLMNKEA